MFEVRVTRKFAAAHAIRIGGTLEPIHGHNWRVVAAVSSATLDAEGLVCDFHLLERALEEAIAPMHNGNLNDLPEFREDSPTAERVAQAIAERMGRALAGKLPASAALARVSVTEAPGCEAVYFIEPD